MYWRVDARELYTVWAVTDHSLKWYTQTHSYETDRQQLQFGIKIWICEAALRGIKTRVKFELLSEWEHEGMWVIFSYPLILTCAWGRHTSGESQNETVWHGETHVKQQDFFQLVYIVCAQFLVIICYIISYFLYAYYIKAWPSSFMVQWPFPGHVMTVGADAATLENMACSASLGRNTTILIRSCFSYVFVLCTD